MVRCRDTVNEWIEVKNGMLQLWLVTMVKAAIADNLSSECREKPVVALNVLHI